MNRQITQNRLSVSKAGFIFPVLLAFLTAGILHSQEEEGTQIIRPVQISLVPPLSTNGFMAGKVTNLFSLNIISGYSGGLNGLEISGFSASEKRNVNGIQVSGFGNTVGGSVHGFQAAGFGNVTGGSVTGFQTAGFMNVTGGATRAMQTAGFMNVGGAELDGFQAAGFMNVQGSDASAAQFAGFMNINGGDFKGFQASGFGNMADKVEGVQVAGFINLAGVVKGAQIGVVNVCDSMEGVPIGVFSFVKQGYRAFEVWTSELLFLNAGFKSGTDILYSIISAGFRPFPEPAWSYGFGLGTHRELSEVFAFDAELTSTYLVDDLFWSRNFNLLNQLKFNGAFRMGGSMAFFVGPSVNVHVSDRNPPDPVNEVVNYAFFDGTSGRKRIRTWIGLQAGFRF